MRVKTVTLFLMAILLFRCLDKGDCIHEATDFVRISFLSDSTHASVTLDIDSIRFTSSDSILYDSISASTVDLPVNPAAPDTEYIIVYQGEQDTLKVMYSSFTAVPSLDCGAIEYYQDLEIIKSTFADAEISDPNLRTNAINIKIYF